MSGLVNGISPVFAAITTAAQAQFLTETPRTCPCYQGTKSYRSGQGLVRETENFRICTPVGHTGVTHFAGTCESLRKHLQTTWLGDKQNAWTPKCEIVLHPTVGQYRQQLGPGSAQSSGCSTLDIDGERVTHLRIDLRADAADWLTAALPHEMTHVVVADRFTRTRIPRWADEGMAILAEPKSKQQIRQREMQACLTQGQGFSADELVRVSNYPQAARRDAFYGQSAALAAHLVEQESPSKFLEFVTLATERGYAAALQETYGEKSLATMRVRWQLLRDNAGESLQLIATRITTIVNATK